MKRVLSRRIGPAASASLITTVLALVLAATAHASGTPRAYCDQLLSPKTACAWANAEVGVASYENAAQYSGSGTVSVCQHSYSYNSGATISDTCDVSCSSATTNWSDSCEDLWSIYDAGGLVDETAGNNDSAHSHTIWGFSYFN